MLPSLLLSVLAVDLCLTVAAPTTWTPKAVTKNGTYEGRYLPQYDEDLFLGIPYAQPPVGDLRFRAPKSLDKTFPGTKSAKAYSNACYGFGPDSYILPVSEDCLYLNVIRPADGTHYSKGQKLPVALWIHGGSFYQGGASNGKFNLSAIVQNGADAGKPFIGVSINYRLLTYGFIGGNAIQAEGNTNIGLRDQRLALQWVQENIAAFGGDPKKVTVWGESAGGSAVGFQLTAFGGRDDGLFRAAVMQSGYPVFFTNMEKTADLEPLIQSMTKLAGCPNSPDPLKCLRAVPTAKMNDIINATAATSQALSVARPYIDGTFIQDLTSKQLKSGAFVKVPVIIGATTDEGTSFSEQNVNTEADFKADLTNTTIFENVPASFVPKVLQAYPDIPAQGIPGSPPLPPNYRPGAPYGAQWRRAAAYYGDTWIVANRRLTCQSWAAQHLTAYCFRWNALNSGFDQEQGVTHFMDVAFVFDNELGLDYAPRPPPFQGKPKSYVDLAKFTSKTWASFFVDLDPNSWREADIGKPGQPPAWPKYDIAAPKDFVFDANVTSYVEGDTFRADAIKLIIDNTGTIYKR